MRLRVGRLGTLFKDEDEDVWHLNEVWLIGRGC